MPIYIGVSGVWKLLQNLSLGVSGSWKTVVSAHIGVSGAWKLIHSNVPSNMVALFASAPSSPWSVLSYSGVFPLGASSEGATNLYSNTHTHGSVTNVFSDCGSMVADDAAIRQNVVSIHGSVHNYSHSHGATDHQPLWQSWRAAQANGAAYIPSSAMLFFSGTSIPTGWTRATYTSGRYVKLDSSGTGGTGGNSTHTHTHPDATNTDSYVERQLGTTYNHPARMAGGHAHTVPSHASEANDPPYITLDMIRPSSDWYSVIPSGVVAFFTGSAVPYGWSYYSAAENRFVKLDSSGIEGTNNISNASHSHSLDDYSGYYTPTSTGGGADGYTCAVLSHRHRVAHTHSAVSNNSMPLSRQLLICRKD